MDRNSLVKSGALTFIVCWLRVLLPIPRDGVLGLDKVSDRVFK